MEAVKALAVLAMALCCALPARSSTDCDPVFGRRHGPDTHAVIAYIDTSTMVARESDLKRLQRHMEGTVLLNYMTSLGAESPSVKRLIFVMCESPRRPTSLTSASDIDVLKSFRVTMAVWRHEEDGKRVIAHSVIPQLDRYKPAEPDELDVVFLDQATAADPLESWLEPVQANSAALSSLLGLGLGLHYLDKGEGPAAKLALCKSRKDLQRSVGNLLRPPQPATQLYQLLDTLLVEADRKIAGKTSSSAELQQRIKAACAA